MVAAAARRGRQERLPGTEGEYPELEKLGRNYATARDSRMELLKEEVALKGKIKEAIRRLELPNLTYQYGDLIMAIVPGEEKLKVKVLKDDEEGTE